MRRYESVERLNRTAVSELTDALRQRDDLVLSARRLAPFTRPPGPGAADHDCCPIARCAFHEVADGAALCALVRALDGLDAPGNTPVSAVEDVPRLVARFLGALTRSLDAVRYCRLTEHPSGRCWFTLASGEPACGEVLRLAHRLGS